MLFIFETSPSDISKLLLVKMHEIFFHYHVKNAQISVQNYFHQNIWNGCFFFFNFPVHRLISLQVLYSMHLQIKVSNVTLVIICVNQRSSSFTTNVKFSCQGRGDDANKPLPRGALFFF